ncbi:hypothetical protein BMS93_02345 [Leuconostoc pseudomesenteroides]|uniref:hypothetical protein n=1 Tax=Leuconostoc falkenbergense TaxID=2766470 RepID=UPI000A04FDDC|nr:hypothetical protein [Leuconostoc falkenbergense]ORI54008.1 hypothetical protein BMS86_02260 [Leuconostoc pseudomesenteroides]MCT4420763.1 hypothetical protein [Leuconostoc falkenbergense]ORI56929.1 hypothetical protein BMS87_01630 [Leuconostoc pseudomesenteroides]ORI76571.1 hypothetical protein BMS89_03820 [Leuconostoc pseudomesenteroides]ORI83896.1 hypothetical protein BMS93_02345 [Leuconostoc pseudomesenteroides]
MLSIEGYAFFPDLPEESQFKIEHEIVVNKVTLINDEVKYDEVYSIIADHQDSNNTRYLASLDFATMTNGHPLIGGQYEVMVRLKQFVDGRWIGQNLTLGRLDNAQVDYTYTTKMRWFRQKVVSTYSFVVIQKKNSQVFNVKVTKLSQINPALLIVKDGVAQGERISILKSKKRIFRFAYNVFKKILPVKENAVAFLSDSREDLTGNFEYIDDELKARGSSLKPTFFFKKVLMNRKLFWNICH